MDLTNAGIIGGGAWGTALSTAMHRAGRSVTLWVRETEAAEQINSLHENQVFLPGIRLDPSIRATSEMADLAACDLILLVVPSQFVRSTCRDAAPHLKKRAPIIVCAKGIETGTGALMGEVVQAELPDHPVAVLSGPTFAAEVADNLPTAITLAVAEDEARSDGLGGALLQAVASLHFRPYLSGDIVGTEVGGAAKNVIAIACGIADGLGFGSNTRAALITRGLAEILRFAVARGGRAETLLGLAGLGDLTLTCSSTQSRNFSFGRALGQGQQADDLLGNRNSVVEGAYNAASVVTAARQLGVAMPICEAVNALLHENVPLSVVVEGLMERPMRGEAPSLEQVVVRSGHST
ncbi:NAD(P)H-dependent glycerol-3-phosphate dehydrogenase [Fodinicurvata sp. EGI_FJ10296]|uniref:NAD(P)H-dependent glycerol-3-phosphate dehydrogenase n=1 Tax=Fodinicurvata sp. EGI_FJ10296 TaxID=3231908 RepID=UPI0034535093